MQIFRITNNQQYSEEELIEFSIKNKEFKMIIEYKTYGPPQGEHIHGWCESNISAQAIGIRIKQQLNCKGNADYSVGQKEVKENDGPDGYKHYCCKSCDEDNIPSIYYNLTEDEVKDYHKQYWIKNKQIKELRKQKPDKSQKDELFAYCTATNNSTLEEDLIPTILNYFREKDKIISNSQVENYYYYISTRMNPKMMMERARCIVSKMARY